MSKRVFSNKIYIATIILAMFLVGCQERPELEPSQYDLVMQYPSQYVDVPVGVAYEFGVSFQRVPADAAKMCLLFDEENLTINYDGRGAIKSGQEIDVSLNNDQKRVSFIAIGKQTGVHKVEALSDDRTWSASGAFSITVKNNAYIINLIDEVMPVIRVGEQQVLNIEAVDVENPGHLFYTSHGFTVSARSLGDVPTIIDLGAELTWNNFIAPFDSIPRGLTWQDNKFSVMYRAYQAGEQHIEFTIKSPRGEISRTVHTLHVDSTRVNLTPNRTASDTVSVTDAYEVNYKVDYLRHPHNQLSCMWEPLEPTDPYSQSPKLFLDGKMDAKAGEWGEYRRTDILGFSAYPIAPNNGGVSKQGFRLHVQDMFGWDTTFEYRFDVKMSDFGFRVIPPTKTPLLQNNYYSFQFELSNYHKGKYRYKFVHPFENELPINLATLYDYVLSVGSDEVWYNLDLSGSDGKRFLESVQVASPYASNTDVGIKVIIEDEFGIQKCAYNSSRFEPNEVVISSSQRPLSLIVGQSSTFNISLAAPRPDNLTFENAILEFPNYEPLYESIEVDGQPLPSKAPYSVVMKNKVASIKYTAKSPTSKELQFNATTWAGQPTYSSIGVSSIIDCGNFTATPDKAAYELPYSEGQVSQDITVTLASDQELAGLYDYNSAFETGTKISCSVIADGSNNDRVVAIDNNGGEFAVSSSPQLLKYTVGKTIKLRHYATKSASASSLNSRVTLTVVRKDGRTTQTVYSLSMTDCGNFTATSDKSTYEIPYSDSRVSQDIVVSLASEREVEGLYDYNSTSRTGTKVSYTSGGRGRVVAVTAVGREIELSSSSLLLDYAVGKTLKLRHYPDATVNGGSIETIRVTVTRKDGALSQFECKITAEDKAFVVEKITGWDKLSIGGRASSGVNIRNLSKYYKGSYRLHSSEYYAGSTNAPNITPTLTQELPLPKALALNKPDYANIWETSDKVGRVAIKHITIADDNGHTVWYEGGSTNDIYYYYEKQ